MEHLLELKDINKSYNSISVVKDITLFLDKGEILGILGENGAGKSTLVKIISGAIQADSGEIYMDGNKVNIRSPKDAKNCGISVVHQDLNLFEEMSVAENICFGNYPSVLWHLSKLISIINWSKIYKSGRKLFEEYGHNISLYKKVKKLSMGEKQIVAIVKALSQHADILVMDEPSTALPENEVLKLLNIIRSVREKGISIIYITHNIEDIYKIADRVIVISDGEKIKDEKVINAKANDLIRSMAGKIAADRYPKLSNVKSSELLRVEGLCSNGIINDVSFKLFKGEILGLTGLLGSGRSTVAKAIFGIDKIQSGHIYIKGKKVSINNPANAVKYGVSYIPEDRTKFGLIPHENIAKNVTIAHLQGIENEKIRWMINKKYENKRVEAYANRLAIKRTSIFQKVENLSGGNQQKVLLARWLFTDADILLLDEPTKAIDIVTKVEIYNMLNELTRAGKGILFISSDLSEILGMCDRILIMHNGYIIKLLMKNEASKELILKYASGGNKYD